MGSGPLPLSLPSPLEASQPSVLSVPSRGQPQQEPSLWQPLLAGGFKALKGFTCSWVLGGFRKPTTTQSPGQP